MATRRAVSAVLWSLSVSMTRRAQDVAHLLLDLRLQLVDLAGLDVLGDVVVGVIAAVGADQPVADPVGGRQPGQVGLAAKDRGGFLAGHGGRASAGVGEASVPQSCVDCPSDDRRPDQRLAASRHAARAHRRRACRGPRRRIAQHRARPLPAGGPAGHPGARLPRPALARLGRGGAPPARGQGAGAEDRCPAARRARPALAGGRAAVRRACAGRSGGVGGAAARQGLGVVRQCRPAALSSRAGGAGRRRLRRAGRALEPSGVVAGAARGRLAGPLAGDRRGRQHPAADDPARQRPPRHGRRAISPSSTRAGLAGEARGRVRRPPAPPGAGRPPAGVRARRASRSRTATPSARSSCCWRRRFLPARASSTPAPPPAARPRSCSSGPTSRCWRSTATRRGWPGSTPPWPASASPARTLAADAARPEAWWDGRPFQAILLDAPCSASGIVRRHPDVRWLRRASDIPALAATQARLLDALWPLLAPGGRLLYCTCSLFRAEGQDQIDAFLQRHGDAFLPASPPSPGHLLPLPDNDKTPSAGPSAAAADGFFLTLIEKHRDTTSS